MSSPSSTPRRLISGAEVRRRVPLSNVQLWRLEKRGEFPRRIAISENRSAYDEAEIDEWIEDRIRNRARRKIPSPSRHKTAAISDAGDC
jgi:prophage regulatory protein